MKHKNRTTGINLGKGIPVNGYSHRYNDEESRSLTELIQRAKERKKELIKEDRKRRKD